MKLAVAPGIDSWPSAGLWLDGDGLIVASNAPCTERLGLSADGLLGRPFTELLAPASRLLWTSTLWPALMVLRSSNA